MVLLHCAPLPCACGGGVVGVREGELGCLGSIRGVRVKTRETGGNVREREERILTG